MLEMKYGFTTGVLIFVTLSIIFIYNTDYGLIWAQSDKSFKGTVAPFVPPPLSERGPQNPPSDGISIKEFTPEEEIIDEEETELERDRLPALTEREFREFFSETDDPEDSISRESVTIIPNKTMDSDPIRNMVEEIINNESIISDEDGIAGLNLSELTSEKERLHQLLTAQEAAIELNETEETSGEITNVTGIPVNGTSEDIEEDDILSETNIPETEVLDFINQTSSNFTAIPSIRDDNTLEETELEGEQESQLPSNGSNIFSNETLDMEGNNMTTETEPFDETTKRTLSAEEQDQQQVAEEEQDQQQVAEEEQDQQQVAEEEQDQQQVA
ncbi:MAG: hypothetical protein ACE5SW_11290, partial [Nitrososphaeraceae archaeon]